MWSAIILALAIVFITLMTTLCYRLGQTRTDNAKQTATIGFCLSFIPPLVLIYLAILLFKDDAGTV